MAAALARTLAWSVLAVTVLVYLLAVAGVLFAAATAPLDVGAVSVLGVGLLFAALAFALTRHPA